MIKSTFGIPLTNDTEAERYRKMMLGQSSELDALKKDNAELTQAYYKLVAKYKKALEDNNNLRVQLNIDKYWDSDSEF